MANEPSWDDIFGPGGGDPARPAPQQPASAEPTVYPGVRASDPFAVAAAEAQAQAQPQPVPHTNLHDGPAATEGLTRRQMRELEEQGAPRGGRGSGRVPSDALTKPKKSRRGLIAVLVIFAVLVAGTGGAAAFVWTTYEQQVRELFGWELPNDYTGTGNGQEALVTISAGDLGDDVARKLLDADVTMTFDAVWDYLLEREAAGDAVVFFPGTFSIQKEMSAESAVAAVTDPANQLVDRVLITEGMSYASALVQISAATGISLEELQAAAADYTSFGIPEESPGIEGWMFPATYQFDPGVTAHDAIQKTVDTMFQVLDANGVAVESRLDILKMAALIQRESGPNVEDMYKISRVFYNRLDQGMNFESDATVAYGTGNLDTVWTTEAERENPDNLYSTYVHPGLPYGPIGLPGEEAIKAAISPADGPWLFFVPINLQTGETVFSETASEHEAAAQQLYAWCRASDENASYCE